MLREAMDRGAVMCGGSAGAICWFGESNELGWSQTCVLTSTITLTLNLNLNLTRTLRTLTQDGGHSDSLDPTTMASYVKGGPAARARVTDEMKSSWKYEATHRRRRRRRRRGRRRRRSRWHRQHAYHATSYSNIGTDINVTTTATNTPPGTYACRPCGSLEASFVPTTTRPR